MGHTAPEFEQEDINGQTTHYAGTVGAATALVPAVAGPRITEAFVRCSIDQTKTNRLSFAIDGSTNYVVLAPGEAIGWGVKSDPTAITQIKILGNAAGVKYEIILNREPT